MADFCFVARLDGVPARDGVERTLARELDTRDRLEEPDEHLAGRTVVRFLQLVAKLLFQVRVQQRFNLELLVGVEDGDDVRVEGLALADGRVQVEDGVRLRVRRLG